MPKWFSEQEKALIHEQLLEQGERMFATYGLKKTNVEEIAAAAGISKGAFYRFYESKEALFMDVIERSEERMRRKILAAVERPGSNPRMRLYELLKEALAVVQTLPILQLISSSDYPLLFRAIPPEKLQEHLESDRVFIGEFVEACKAAGIPIRVGPERLGALLYPLVLALLHADELGRREITASVDMNLELVAACCVGEVEIKLAG